MRTKLTALIVLGLLAAALPGVASAQTSCTTFFANSDMPMTNCSTPAGTVNCTTFFADTDMPMTHCDGPPSPPPVVYVAPSAPPPPAQAPAPAVDPGLYYRDDAGQVAYLPLGTFVKGSDAPAIYVVAYEQLHAFSTWGQFLRYGGRNDLGNVRQFVTVPPALVGVPAPN